MNAQPMQDLQQVGALQAIAQKMQAAQQDAMLKQSVAQSGGDLTKAYQAALNSGNVSAAAKLAPLIEAQRKASMPQPGQPIGSGGLRLPDGTMIAPMARPDSGAPKAPTMRTRVVGETQIQEEYQPDGTWKEVGKGPRFARQVSPVVVSGGGSGQRAPVGFQFKEDGTLEPIKGGPKDPTIHLTGGRESVYVQRMMMGANQAAKDLSNVVQLQLTASTGFFGGRKQGAGLLDAGKEVLANKATGQEAQAYNAMATGFQRSLAQIESAGLMPSGSLTHQMDAVLFKEGDTNLTKLHKLAQTRQIVEAGMEVIQANPRVSEPEKAKVKSVLDSIRKSVPFTHSDLINLQVAQETNPNATLKEIVGKKNEANGGWSIKPR